MNIYEAKLRLRDGNGRYITGRLSYKDLGAAKREALFEHGQQPYAVIVCCSDSRVPPEIIFDEGLGELFVVRTAGNVVDEVALGSVEYGAEHLGIPLVVVLGHAKCGAVAATAGGGEAHGCIRSIVDKIRPSLDRVRDCPDVLAACEDENIRNTVSVICENRVIRELIVRGLLEVIGAKYELDTGEVRFFSA